MELDLHSLLRIARRWWVLLIIAPMIGGATAFSMGSRQPEIYSAEATLLVNTGVNSGVSADNIRAGQNLLETYSIWIVSHPVLDRVVEKLDLEGGTSALADQLTTRSVSDTLFIEIAIEDHDPATAALIANTVAEEFVLYVGDQADIQNTQLKSNLTVQIDETAQEIARLDAEIATLQANQETLTVAEQNQLTSLLNQRDRLDRDLTQLQATVGALEVELASTQTRILVSAPAVEPQYPIGPNVQRMILLGIAVSITLAMAAAILLEYLDNTIRRQDEVEKIVGSPILASVASAPEIRRDGQQLFVLGSPMSGPSEAMRLLRTNLAFACAPNDMSTIVISSAGPEDGKSTLTGNLAVVMAQAGLKTVVIDADLRRPSQHHIFGLHNDRGLTTLLTQADMDWRDVAVPLNIPGMWIVPSGPLPPNPADLLGLPRFSQILDNIRESVDVILIDTAPALAVSDALIVARKTDGAILVCRPGQTRRDALRRTTAAFSQGHIKLLGFVMNRVKHDVDEYDGYEQVATAAEPSRGRFYYGDRHSDLPLPRSIFRVGKSRTNQTDVKEGFMANEM